MTRSAADEKASDRKLRVTLVMPVRNEEASIETTLGSLVAGSRLPDEVIIADGRSTDGTVSGIQEFAKRHPEISIRVVDNPGLWAGGGRNRAIEQSTGDIILLADFGNAFRPNWVELMVQPYLDNPSVDIVCGLFRPKVDTDFQHCVAVVHMLDDYMLEQIPQENREALLPEVVVPVGMAMSITKDVYDDVGGFPEWLFKGQDKLFGRKAWAKNKKIVVAWDSLVDHHVRATPKQVFNYMYFYGRGFGQQHLVSNMTRKLALIYGVFFALVIAGFIWPILWGLAVILAGAHFWKFGFRKHFQQTIRPWKWRYLYLLPLALVSRDLGSIFGHISGWIHWWTRPDLRKKYKEYLADVDPSRLQIVSK